MQTLSSDGFQSEQFRAVVNTAVDGIIIIDSKGIVQMVNPAVEKLFEYNKQEIIGNNISMLMPQPHREKHDGYIDNYHKTRKKKIIGIGRELFAQKKDGTLFPILLGVSEFEIKGNKLFTGIIHDLTEIKQYQIQLQRTTEEIEKRKNIEKALHNSQQMYYAITSNFPNGSINVLDKDLTYIFSDGEELQELGVDNKLLKGVNLMDHLPQEEGGIFKKKLKEAFKGRNVSFETKLNNRYFLINAVPLPNGSGEIEQIMVVGQNINEQKKSEQKIKDALSKEKELNELKSRFVSMASHEFRTPLAAMLSSISLIDKYRIMEEPDGQIRHVQKIKNNIKVLTQILNDFLSLGRLEEGKMFYKPAKLYLIQFIENSINDIKDILTPNQSLQVEIPEKEIRVFVDPQILKNVLNNLISNASKYSTSNGKIRIGVIAKNDKVSIQVEDKGIGIPLSDQKMLFQRFFRASNANNIHGTGIGLNIVKKYVDLMDGKINFTSVQDEGTTFTITISKLEE